MLLPILVVQIFQSYYMTRLVLQKGIHLFSLIYYRATTILKNMRDFRSNITCLSTDRSCEREERSPEQIVRAETTKYNRNLLTTFETSALIR